MGHPGQESAPNIGRIASLLDISPEIFHHNERELGILAELLDVFLEKNNAEWIRQNNRIILDQWELLLSLGIE